MNGTERANAVKCATAEGLFGMGLGFVAVVTVLPLLMKSLGASDFEVGLAGSIGMAGYGMLQPVSMLLFGGRRRTKRFLVSWSFSFVAPTYLAMAAVVLLLAPQQPRLCSMLLLALLAVRVFGGGASAPFWFDWQAAIFPQDIRGRVIGMMAGASALGFSAAAYAAGMAHGRLPFPVNYSVLFVVAVVFFALGLGVYAQVREPDSVGAPAQGLRPRELFGRFGHSLSDANFRSYLAGRILLVLGSGASAFYAVHFNSPEGGGIAADTVVKLGMFIAIPQVAASYLLGRLGDRVGHKSGVVIGAAAQLASIAAAFLGRGTAACVLSFVFLGIAGSAAWVSNLNFLLETCPHDNRVAHITLTSTILQPLFFLVPMGTGWMMENLAHRATGIGLTLVPTLLGVAWLAFVLKEPRDVDLTARGAGMARAA
jgi:MFS family permease